jgi:hypothetical protein
MNDLRKEREHVARRWEIATSVAIAILVVTLSALCLARTAIRECGSQLFGWGSGHRRCTLSETWSWLCSGADWVFWVYSSVLVLALVGSLLRNRNS